MTHGLGSSPIRGQEPPDVADTSGEKVDEVPLAIIGDVIFIPEFSPENVRVRKVRNLDRSDDVCKGENVADDGAENREIHITGKAIGPERHVIDQLGDSDEAMDLTNSTWTGEIRVSEAEYEGPTGWHPPSGHYYYDYTMDLVSTGPNAEDRPQGVIREPEPNLTEQYAVEAHDSAIEALSSVEELQAWLRRRTEEEKQELLQSIIDDLL